MPDEPPKETRKRKRQETGQSLSNMQIPKSYENEDRIGYVGRGTAQNQDIKGLIGDVYDTQGHLLYDKDYKS